MPVTVGGQVAALLYADDGAEWGRGRAEGAGELARDAGAAGASRRAVPRSADRDSRPAGLERRRRRARPYTAARALSYLQATRQVADTDGDASLLGSQHSVGVSWTPFRVDAPHRPRAQVRADVGSELPSVRRVTGSVLHVGLAAGSSLALLAVLLELARSSTLGVVPSLRADASRPALQAHCASARSDATSASSGWCPPGTRAGAADQEHAPRPIGVGCRPDRAGAICRRAAARQPARAGADAARRLCRVLHARSPSSAPGVRSAARDRFRRLNEARVPGVLGEWALLGEAMAAEQLAAYADAARLFETALERKPEKPDEVLAGLGRNQLAAGARDKALATFRQLYFELSAEHAVGAGAAAAGAARRADRGRSAEAGLCRRSSAAPSTCSARAATPRRFPPSEAIAGIASGDDAEKVQSAHRRMRVLPRTLPAGARRRASLRRPCVAQGRGPLLRGLGAARARAITTPTSPKLGKLIDGLSRQRLGRRSAEQPRDALHPGRRGPVGRGGVRAVSRSLSTRSLRAAGGVEAGLVAIPPGRQRCGDRDLRTRGRRVPAVRLSSRLAVLDGARPTSG